MSQSVSESLQVIVAVDDGFSHGAVFSADLEAAGFDYRVVPAGVRTPVEIEACDPDIILLSDSLALFDPFELCAALKAHDSLRHVPIVLAGTGDSATRVRALEHGASDYFRLEMSVEELLARTRRHISQFRQLQQLHDARLRERAYFEKISRMRDDLMQTASHDLKNPMTAIKLSVSILQRYLDRDDPKVERHLARISKGVDRIHELINAMFDLTLLREDLEMEYRPVSVSRFLDDYAGPFVAIAEQQGIHLTISPPDHDVRISIDPAQLGRALQNVVGNSLSYTEPGGRIEVGAVYGEDRLRIAVTDTGIGIPESDLPHVFNILYRVDDVSHNKNRGIGLGLAVVKAIIDRHSGAVDIESRVGEGTTVVLSVPLSAQPAHAARATVHQTAF